jgi:hypothetical protein
MRYYYQSRNIRGAAFTDVEGHAYLRRWCLFLSRADPYSMRQGGSCQEHLCWKRSMEDFQ